MRFLILLFLSGCYLSKPPLPIFGELTNWSFSDENEKSWSLGDLKGRVSLVYLFFSQCQGPCPLVAKNIAQVESNLPKNVQILGVSADPSRDTPESLKSYKARLTDSQRWHFFGGASSLDLDQLVKELHLSSLPQPEYHSTRLVLLDNESKIRGYYEGRDPKSLDQMCEDLKTLTL